MTESLLPSGANDRAQIARAAGEYASKTCIRWVPRTNERNYVHILRGSGYVLGRHKLIGVVDVSRS